ncbi:MAG TPA: hypothetical protein ENG92_05445 [Thiolapillus brandeum]|uniref:Protein-tyrosine-phosphatase n=1 Tax=Thiolapillus brandeum TaxID=1076588 RepID=A0A831JSE1_9GAMM|nr:hypothetical protein [Thiolapillus brandeum]
MLDDGLVHLLATDAHNLKSRPPLLAEAEQAAIKHVGVEEAGRLVLDRPKAIWKNSHPGQLTPPPGYNENGEFHLHKKRGVLGKLFFGH